MSKPTIAPKQPLLAHSSMKKSLEMALRPVSLYLKSRNIHVLHHLLNEYSPNRDICRDICLHGMLRSS